MGEVVVELYWKQAPLTCRNFAELARRGYYNDTKFHRIIKVGFVFFLQRFVPDHFMLSLHSHCKVQ